MATIEDLKLKIKQLELELEAARQTNGPGRSKISEMSSEVVDSNPYRFKY